MLNKDIVLELQKLYGFECTIKQLYSFAYYNKLKKDKVWNKGTKGICKGNSGSFKDGHIPKNKGTKGLTGANRTSFKKGHLPANIRKLGEERICKSYGYISVKVAEPNKWKLKHRLVWEETYGEIPKNKIVVFLDGNKLNCDIDNLAMISKSENLLMNRRKYYNSNPEITKAYINLVRLEVRKNERKKELKK